MKKKTLRLFLVLLPLFAVLFTTSCADEASDEGKDPVEEQKPIEPLIDREPEVKEYFKVTNELIEEYLNVGESILTVVEKFEEGKMGLAEGAAAGAELITAWESIDELSKSLEQQGTIKENIEASLNPKDALEFAEMYSESAARIEELSKRIEAIDVDTYLKVAKMFNPI